MRFNVKSFCYHWLVLREEVVADEERSQVAREVLVAGDGVSGDAREGQSVEALPEDREVVVEEILERPVLGRRLVLIDSSINQ